jgi:hypothetical protein
LLLLPQPLAKRRSAIRLTRAPPNKAKLLLDALADVAIIAIIGKATGHQKRRSHNALQTILAPYIASELMPRQKQFPGSY